MTKSWLSVRLHPTWHFTVFCAGIISGLALSPQAWAQAVSDPAWIVVAAALVILAGWWRWRWLLAIALCAGLLAGMSRGAYDGAARTVYDTFRGQMVTLQASVEEDVDRGKHGELLLRLEGVTMNGRALPAGVWVSAGEDYAVRRSDRVVVRGQLEEGFGSFAAAMYRAEILQVHRPQPGDVALDVREDFGEKVREGISEPAASLGMGFLTGQRRGLPPELDEALRVAGLTHIVVASGYNLTILVRLMRRLLARHSRYLAVFGSLLLVAGFIAVTGLSPSMMRAGLVASLMLGAWYLGRQFHPVTLLAFVAAVTGLIEPSYVWGNLGWQLSFAAFAGVMIVAPLAQQYFFGDKQPGMIRQIMGETMSAQLVTAPLLLYNFGYISNVALIANAAILPLLPLAMLLTFIAGIAGYVAPWVATIIALPAQWLLDYMVWVATTMAEQSWALTTFALPLWGMIVSFAAIGAASLYMRWATGYRLRESNVVE